MIDISSQPVGAAAFSHASEYMCRTADTKAELRGNHFKDDLEGKLPLLDLDLLDWSDGSGCISPFICDSGRKVSFSALP